MKIGELATAAQCDAETVRYYEREGLLPPPARSASNYRSYGPSHLERLQFIRRCRSLDMALDEVRVLLSFLDAPDRNCGDVNRLLEEHIRHVDTRLKELSALELQLKKLRRQCRRVQAARACGILTELASAPARKAKAKSHVRGLHSKR